MSLKTRRRGTELEDAILAAGWDVLVERGYHGFTYEAVAERAGTSRPVLYRRWPQREDLLLATVARSWSAAPIEIPDTGHLREDMLGFLRNADAGRSRTIMLVGVQLMEYFRETGTSFDELRAHLRPPGQRNGCEVIVERAVGRGELPDVPYPARVVVLPFDLLRHDLLMTMRSVPDEKIVEIVDVIWLPLLRVTASEIRLTAPII
ncbi:TetR/AcrR family transcriptional regulator [Dactylosporangium sp. CS-047395]|uniref:TetR/AcrR family transcriptional regulator n=1 Tax=Dactylosporangium sp. CS-047395 TaxID=3239936 RepID=UPI003D925F4D